MLKEIIIAITAYGKAHKIIKSHKLWKWIFLPGLLYMLLFVGSLYVFTLTVRKAVHFEFLETFGISQWLEQTNSALLHFMFSFTGLVLWLLGVLIYFSLFKYVWLIVGAPIFSRLSEKTETLVNGWTFEFTYAQWLKDMGRGVRIALRSLLWQSVYFVALILLAFIPVIGWAVPFFAIIIEAYYFGFSMIDYNFERRNEGMTASIRYIGANKGLAIGNGMVFFALHLIPIAGWIFAPAYAIMAATITVVDNE